MEKPDPQHGKPASQAPGRRPEGEPPCKARPPRLDDMRAARQTLTGFVLRTPLLRLSCGEDGGGMEIYLKLENLQPAGAFKLRPVINIFKNLPPEALARGVFTASSGNLGISVAWAARQLGIEAHIVLPADAPEAKRAVLARLGARQYCVSFDEWWQTILTRSYEGLDALYIDGVTDPHALAANATIGLEILEDLPDVDTVMVPFGGGGLSCGIAAALRARRSRARVIACELETATPVRAALGAGRPVETDWRPSFVSGIGARTVLPSMWPLIRDLIDGTAVVTLADTAAAVRLIAEHARTVAEGAGAVALAAALSGQGGKGKIVCVVSGGNISSAHLATILAGGIPEPPGPA